MSAALAAAGILIIIAGWNDQRHPGSENSVGLRGSCWIGGIQGVCLPFRGFSRSGATISMGLLLGITKRKAEEFSFALAVVLTPPVIAREVWRLLEAQHLSTLSAHRTAELFYPSLLGMVLSFIAGILALKWLSNWLERGRWHIFGIYCLCASVVIFFLYRNGL
jgi:undecaprenyl-diphosphatase